MNEPEYSVDPLYAVADRLNDLHDRAGLSWREIARSVEFEGISHTTLRDIAKKRRASRKTRQRLGLPPQRIRIAADVSPDQRSRLHNLAAGLGHTWSSLCQALADGALLIGRDHD